MAFPQVIVELYVDGNGPRHVFNAPLKGWDQNRLDLQSITQTYRLKNLYAYSVGSGRGNRLFFNPRNGLSLIAYSGKPDVVIRLDGDSKDSYLVLLAKPLVGAILLGGVIFLAISDSLPESVRHLRNITGRQIAWIVCFFCMVYTQLIWRPSRKKNQRWDAVLFGKNMTLDVKDGDALI